MADARNKFMQPDEDTPFGRQLKEVTRYLNIGVPSFTGTYNATFTGREALDDSSSSSRKDAHASH